MCVCMRHSGLNSRSHISSPVVSTQMMLPYPASGNSAFTSAGNVQAQWPSPIVPHSTGSAIAFSIASSQDRHGTGIAAAAAGSAHHFRSGSTNGDRATALHASSRDAEDSKTPASSDAVSPRSAAAVDHDRVVNGHVSMLPAPLLPVRTSSEPRDTRRPVDQTAVSTSSSTTSAPMMSSNTTATVPDSVTSWTVEHVSQWLQRIGLPQV